MKWLRRARLHALHAYLSSSAAEAVRPDELHAEDLQRQEQQETDRNMEEMWHVLRGAGGR